MRSVQVRSLLRLKVVLGCLDASKAARTVSFDYAGLFSDFCSACLTFLNVVINRPLLMALIITIYNETVIKNSVSRAQAD